MSAPIEIEILTAPRVQDEEHPWSVRLRMMQGTKMPMTVDLACTEQQMTFFREWRDAPQSETAPHVGWVQWPFSYQYADGLLTLRMADGSRAWFKNGKLYIKQDQLDEKHVMIQAELDGTDFVGVG
jgi:hypothetical protein